MTSDKKATTDSLNKTVRRYLKAKNRVKGLMDQIAIWQADLEPEEKAVREGREKIRLTMETTGKQKVYAGDIMFVLIPGVDDGESVLHEEESDTLIVSPSIQT